MASALWLGFSEPGRLAPFLALPVQVMVLPRLPQKAPLSGQRFFTPAAGAPMMAALAGRDLYYIGVDDFSPIPIPPSHGRLLAPAARSGLPRHRPGSNTRRCAAFFRRRNPAPFTLPAAKCAAQWWRRIICP